MVAEVDKLYQAAMMLEQATVDRCERIAWILSLAT